MSFMNLFAQEAMYGNITGLRNGIEQRHLQPCPQRVVPHQRCSIFALSARDIIIGRDAPSVIKKRFSMPCVTAL